VWLRGGLGRLCAWRAGARVRRRGLAAPGRRVATMPPASGGAVGRSGWSADEVVVEAVFERPSAVRAVVAWLLAALGRLWRVGVRGCGRAIAAGRRGVAVLSPAVRRVARQVLDRLVGAVGGAGSLFAVSWAGGAGAGRR
jgi:hypothetical protein